jgi:hypothetical protein
LKPSLRSRHAGAAGHLAGDHLEEHRAVLRAVVELELTEAAELLSLLRLGGAQREAWAVVGDLAEAAGRALEFDRALLERHPAGFLDRDRDIVARLLRELGDVFRRDRQFDPRDHSGEQRVRRDVDGRRRLGLRGSDAEEEKGVGAEAFHDRRGRLTMLSSPGGGNWIGLG